MCPSQRRGRRPATSGRSEAPARSGLPEHLRVRRTAPNGKPGCRYCGGDLPGHQWSYCPAPAECRHLYRLGSESEYARACVCARDRGVCAGCGEDTYREHAWRLSSPWLAPVPLPRTMLYPTLRRVHRYGAWDCDHIVEVKRGGLSEMGNLQTLCRPCHKRKTARFAAERAEERRAAKT